MRKEHIRQPVQKRSIEKKEKIIESGFNLICEKGYHNTNTAEIAKKANVSTGIVYQYFKDKHDILIEGMKLYSSSIFYPMLYTSGLDSKTDITIDNLPSLLEDMINKFIKNHKISKIAHEEINAMTHSDPEVADIYHDTEMRITNKLTNILLNNGFNEENIKEKVHMSVNMIDNLCHEIVYHKHKELDYDKMIQVVINNITYMLK